MFPLFLRRFLPLVLAAASLPLAVTPTARAKADDSAGGAPIDVNFFYDTLKDDGSWYNTTEYGDVWQPYIAYKSDSWRPYTDGYWSYTDGGWMFVSNENFGWAVYHYGRWTRLKDVGWAWVPGTDWAPAWVTWRASKTDNNGPPAMPDGSAPATAAIDATSTNAGPADASSTNAGPATVPDDKNGPPPGDSSAPPVVHSGPVGNGGGPVSQNYIGWAPLPPEPAAYTEVDYTYGPTVDVDFGIDPYDYCFTDVRYFGAPYVAAVIFDPFQSFYYADHSVNITNIYYNHSGRYNGFYAGGPDYNRMRGFSQHPIPQYNLRQSSGASAQSAIRAGKFNRISGNTLGVAAPQFSRRGVGSNGRVNLTRAGALAKAEVNRGAPAAAADNPAYKQARESFTKQGDTFRTEHPNAPGSRAAALQAAGKGSAVPETGPKIQTTARAQQEEHDARQAAGEKVPPATESRDDALKNRTTGTPETHPATNEAKTEPKTEVKTEAKTEGGRETSGETASETRHSGRTHSSSGTRHTSTVSREQALESAGRSHGSSAPRVVQQRSAPKVVAQPRPQVAAPAGGGKSEDKKKK